MTAFRGLSQVLVVDRTRAQKLISSTRTSPFVDHLISIVDASPTPNRASSRWPHGIGNIASVCRIRFDDDDDDDERTGRTPPEAAHVRRIIAFLEPRLDYFRNAAPEGKRFLIHCWAGKSRSTATALIGYSMAYPDNGNLALLLLLAACEQGQTPQPNMRMIRIADELLNREGRLMETAKALTVVLSLKETIRQGVAEGMKPLADFTTQASAFFKKVHELAEALEKNVR